MRYFFIRDDMMAMAVKAVTKGLNIEWSGSCLFIIKILLSTFVIIYVTIRVCISSIILFFTRLVKVIIIIFMVSKWRLWSMSMVISFAVTSWLAGWFHIGKWNLIKFIWNPISTSLLLFRRSRWVYWRWHIDFLFMFSKFIKYFYTNQFI